MDSKSLKTPALEIAANDGDAYRICDRPQKLRDEKLHALELVEFRVFRGFRAHMSGRRPVACAKRKYDSPEDVVLIGKEWPLVRRIRA